MRMKDGRIFPRQMVIQSVGVKPNTAFLTGLGIALETGIPVNPLMETYIPAVYADCSNILAFLKIGNTQFEVQTLR